MVTTALLTIDDYEQLPQAIAETHELIDGVLVEVAGNVPEHNFLKDLLVALLLPLAEKQKLGIIVSEQEFDFNGRTHAPDVSFVNARKAPLFERRKRVQRFVPDLAIEIASQANSFDELVEKVIRYRDCGTAEAWIFSIAPRRVFVFSEGRNVILGSSDTLTTELLPGLSLPIDDVFEGIIRRF